ncbi:Ppx/GppA phosphatase family protein [Propylenella binzhouense]|uniref:Ppx/GppA family phosphatase n=1 Tax=Propylenella binzhouense TaxID=2555902 RepID=A0A964T942_9HYPH|nr:Ppx/GppA phosphatase family protein [Propylenella binzhouense]MYZ49602.1 Ppx/GppA family phosphatase [Propylenella binzhouense]
MINLSDAATASGSGAAKAESEPERGLELTEDLFGRNDPAERGTVPTENRAAHDGRAQPSSRPPSRHAGHRKGHGAHGPLYAALDLGTNNCRLLIAEPRNETFRVVDSFSRIVRLGEGVAQTGRLSEGAMSRAFAALRICRQKIGERAVLRTRLIATEACRRAANGQAFLAGVRADLGLDLEIIDRRTEASLAVAGCCALLDPGTEGAVLFDIGGGSSEIVWLDCQRGPRRNGLMRAWVSLPVGVVTLAERFGGVDVDAAIFEAMVGAVRAEFHRFRAREALREAVSRRRFHFLGTSGTVTTLAGVHLDLPRYDRRHVDGLWMDDADIGRMMAKITAMSYEQRVSNPCIGRERADLVLAGCAIFEAIRREWPCDRLRVADRGLREGILVQMMRADGFLRGPRRLRHEGAGALA